MDKKPPKLKPGNRDISSECSFSFEWFLNILAFHMSSTLLALRSIFNF